MFDIIRMAYMKDKNNKSRRRRWDNGSRGWSDTLRRKEKGHEPRNAYRK